MRTHAHVRVYTQTYIKHGCRSKMVTTPQHIIFQRFWRMACFETQPNLWLQEEKRRCLAFSLSHRRRWTLRDVRRKIRNIITIIVPFICIERHYTMIIKGACDIITLVKKIRDGRRCRENRKHSADIRDAQSSRIDHEKPGRNAAFSKTENRRFSSCYSLPSASGSLSG